MPAKPPFDRNVDNNWFFKDSASAREQTSLNFPIRKYCDFISVLLQFDVGMLKTIGFRMVSA